MSHIPARRRALRLATVLSLAATATVLGAAPAFAHVTAQPGDAAQGSYSVVSLRVPNESVGVNPVGRWPSGCRQPGRGAVQ